MVWIHASWGLGFIFTMTRTYEIMIKSEFHHGLDLFLL